MKNILRFINFINNKFLNKQLDFRVRLFNVMAIAGIIISLVSAGVCIVNGEGLLTALANLTTTFVAFGLMIFASRTGRYQLCYMITIIVIFLLFFPVIFFLGGGYSGAMPFYFIFAVIFTLFMLEGKKALTTSGIELLVYIVLCIYGYYNPETIQQLTTESAVFIDTIVGFTAVSIALGVTMFIHFRLYNSQQRELEAAREEALKLSEAKSNFLANMSHEIRTPINVILGMNEMILIENESEYIKNYSVNIQNAGRTLLLLINNVLDVSRIESGKIAVSEEFYETADLINELSVTGTELANRYNLEFRCETDENLPRGLTGDFLHIKQIAENFLSNAAKYTKCGGITLSFKRKRYIGKEGKDGKDSKDGSEDLTKIVLHIAVADTGIGIKQENIPFLFDAFVRADMPSNKYIEGTGLGLAIAKELTELMNGHIGVESVWEKGSVFSVELPQKISDETPLGIYAGFDIKFPKEEYSSAGSFIAPEGVVLAVDDNKENLQVLKSLLSHTMLRLDTAASGAECIKMVKKSKYDIILMDYMMSGMDGEETLKHLKEIDGFNTPTAALTANVVKGVKQKLLDSGFCEYLSKPIIRRDLESLLIRFLPQEIVTFNTAHSGRIIPDEMKNKIAKELEDYGIVLDNGLHYLSGDIFQYKKIAEFFVENYGSLNSGKREISGLAAKKDWGRFKFCIHSLKSKSRAVGAVNLSNTAAKLENLCAADGKTDESYIETILPVLYYEWELACEGLVNFNVRFRSVMKETHDTEQFANHGNLPKLGELMSLIKHNRQPDALEALDKLITGGDFAEIAEIAEIKDKLREIKQRVDEVEFREAESLLTMLMGGEIECE